jgi:HEXXH motif-containing protein
LITTHSLSADAFLQLASGTGDSVVVRQLHEAQLSKHLMLLHVVVEAANGIDPPSRATAAFRAGYRLLAEARAADPAAVARLLGLPHIGSWAHDCLACLDTGTPPDFGYLAAVAAAAAVRLGIQFELDVPVRDGRVQLPGLGCLQVASLGEWVRLSSDGERLRDGEHIDVPCAALVPDDGSGGTVPHWQGTPLLRALTHGQAWEVLLESADRHLDRYALPMLTAMTPALVTSWRQLIQTAWELLVRHHEWAAGPIAAGVHVVVPLVPRSDLDSATSPAAFGAIATSLPPSPVSMAETLIHEFQHIKLSGLMDMLPLIKPSDERGYAPWRDDPRPMGGILQGVYAFTGVVRFWDIQRCLEVEPDGVLRASVLYERWRLVIEPVARTLLETGLLTPDGVSFVTALRERGQRRRSGPVPAEATEVAREVALDNWLTWQLAHTALDAAGVAGLAAAYQRGEPLGGQVLPGTWIEDDIRKIDSIPRSRLLNLRYQEPRRYRQLSATDIPELDAADALLVRGDADAAVAAYRAGLAAEPDPADWIGLALAINRLPATPSRQVFAVRLPLLFEMHACLASHGIHADPLELAAWFE